MELVINKSWRRRDEDQAQWKDEKIGGRKEIKDPVGKRKRHLEILGYSRKDKNPIKFRIRSQHLPN